LKADDYVGPADEFVGPPGSGAWKNSSRISSKIGESRGVEVFLPDIEAEDRRVHDFEDRKTEKEHREMRKVGALGLALAMTSLFLAAALVDVSGTWELTMTTQRGEMKSDVTFKQDGENLAVTTMMRNQEVTGKGTVKGNDVEWTITRTTQRGEFSTTYKGKVEGNKMTGTVEMGGRGGGQGMTIEWTAVKK
jgi:hypothetical protein